MNQSQTTPSIARHARQLSAALASDAAARGGADGAAIVGAVTGMLIRALIREAHCAECREATIQEIIVAVIMEAARHGIVVAVDRAGEAEMAVVGRVN